MKSAAEVEKVTQNRRGAKNRGRGGWSTNEGQSEGCDEPPEDVLR